MKLLLSLAAAFAAFTLTTAEKAPGDIIQLKTVSSSQTDQVRILTKPRPGYNAANDAPSVYNLKDDACEDLSASNFVFAVVDDASKCCKKSYLEGFNLWKEKQDYTIPAGANIVAQEQFALDNAFESNGCFERTSKSGQGSYTLQAGETYNVYMTQTLSYDLSKKYYDNLIEFHKYV